MYISYSYYIMYYNIYVVQRQSYNKIINSMPDFYYVGTYVRTYYVHMPFDTTVRVLSNQRSWSYFLGVSKKKNLTFFFVVHLNLARRYRKIKVKQ